VGPPSPEPTERQGFMTLFQRRVHISWAFSDVQNYN